MRKNLLYAAPIVLTVMLAGCSSAGIINAFEGSDRPNREVAILFTPQEKTAGEKQDRAFFSAVDGKNYGSYMNGYPTVTKVLPGDVTIKVLCTTSSSPLSAYRIIQTRLVAGHYYELSCDLMKASCTDRGTDYTSVRDLLSKSAQEKLR